LDEMNVELIRNTLYKAYLEAFYEFCENMGGETAEVMCEILSVSGSGALVKVPKKGESINFFFSLKRIVVLLLLPSIPSTRS